MFKLFETNDGSKYFVDGDTVHDVTLPIEYGEETFDSLVGGAIEYGTDDWTTEQHPFDESDFEHPETDLLRERQ